MQRTRSTSLGLSGSVLDVLRCTHCCYPDKLPWPGHGQRREREKFAMVRALLLKY